MQIWKWSKALHPWSSGRGKLESTAIISHYLGHITLVQTGSGEEPGISVFIDVKWSSEEEGRINSLPWYQSPSQPPAHHSLPSWPLCHILLCHGCSVLLMLPVCTQTCSCGCSPHRCCRDCGSEASFTVSGSLPERKFLSWMRKKMVF